MITKNILKGVALSAVLLPLATGCSEETTLAGGDTGSLKLDVDFVAAPLTGTQAASRASVENPITADQLTFSLTALDGDFSQSWPLAEFDPSEQIPVGGYLAEAYYGTADDEGYGKPYYYGSEETHVYTDRTTDLSFTVKLKNSIVRLVLTDNFKKYMKDYTATVGNIVYDENATDELYVKAGAVPVYLSFTRPNGKSESNVEIALIEAKEQYRHTLTLDVDCGWLGDPSADPAQAALTVTCDETLDNVEYEIDLSQDLTSASAPTLTFDPAEVTNVDVVESVKPEQSVKMNVVARGKIKSVMLTTESAALAAKGWPAEVDLANPGDSKALLESMGLKTLGIWNNPDVMGMIDFTGLLPNIPYSEGAEKSTFTVRVIDAQTKQSDALTFSVTMHKLNLAVTAGGIDEPGKAYATIEYNGADVNDVKFFFDTDRGVEKAVAATVTPSATPGKYEVEFTYSPADTEIIMNGNEVHLTAKAGNLEAKYILKALAATLDATTVNAFAKRAFVNVQFLDDETAAKSSSVRFQVSPDQNNANFKDVTGQIRTRAARSRAVVETKTYEIQGLEPGKTQYVRAIIDGRKTIAIPVTTEAATQLGRNDNCDTAPSINGSASHWENYVFPDGWGTNNTMTTSQGSNYGYCRVSGTIPVTGSDAYNNGTSISIRTCGWGSGNSALIGVTGACKYIDAGLYHLGATRTIRPDGYKDRSGSLNTDDLDCGVPFASRPSALSFQYKYTAKNSADHGEVLIRMIDASGNVIAEQKADLSAQSEYGKKTIALNYSSVSPKAAKIYIRFLSTNVQEALSKDRNWLNGPGAGNLSRGTYMGSQLYIDDIELIY
jgi:hypothetical protein